MIQIWGHKKRTWISGVGVHSQVIKAVRRSLGERAIATYVKIDDGRGGGRS